MNYKNLIKIALKALANNKFRGFLTMLGIIIGVASVIAMLAIGIPAMRTICFHFLLAGMSIILSSTFQALGNGMFSLIVSVCRPLYRSITSGR